jgi:Lecithin:cholesterol acyltransferase
MQSIQRATSHAPPHCTSITGILGSDLDVRLRSPLGPCASGSSAFTLWPPLNTDLIKNVACFRYLLQPVPCQVSGISGTGGNAGATGASTGATTASLPLCSNPGVSTWVDPGGDDGSRTITFKKGYSRLVDFLVKTLGYKLGRDLFAAPYDWRLGLEALEAGGGFDAIAARVQDAVGRNCGRRAVILGHSMGTVVALGMLQNPRFAAWRCGMALRNDECMHTSSQRVVHSHTTEQWQRMRTQQSDQCTY